MKKMLMMALVVGGLGAAGGLAALCPCAISSGAAYAAEAAPVASQAIHVEGVDCASCTIAIRHALKKLEGVRDVQPDASDKSQVMVTYEPSRVKPSQLLEVVTKLGFNATLVGSKTGT